MLCLFMKKQPEKNRNVIEETFVAVPLPEIAQYPVIHKALPTELVERVRKFEFVFDEVFPRSHEKWIDIFSRDLDPEIEVSFCECVAASYQAALTKQHRTMPEKKEIFLLLLLGSEVPLKHLTRQEAQQILDVFNSERSKKYATLEWRN